MIGFLLPIAVRLVGPRFAKAAVYAFLIAAAVAAFFGAKAIYDHSIISAHDAKQENKELRGVVKRERAANTVDQAAQQRDQADADKMRGAIDNAVQAHPQEAARPSGPATSAALDELRARRAARDRGK